jgi:hypothetical protein
VTIDSSAGKLVDIFGMPRFRKLGAMNSTHRRTRVRLLAGISPAEAPATSSDEALII